MTIYEKIEQSQATINRVISVYRRPVIMSSFGKDSMVMLDIIERMGLRFPVIFHREPFFPEKYAFANRIIADKKLTVYDYPPSSTAIVENNGMTEIVNYYQVGAKMLYLPTGVIPKAEGEYLCGFRDLYQKPLGQFAFPWDIGFLGHKSSDKDPILGDIPLSVDVKSNVGSCSYCFPIRHFTDDDIWYYHKLFNVPVHETRYDSKNGHKEFADKTHNPDYFPACTACMSESSPPSVFCPKLQMEISNISKEVARVNVEKPQYIGG